MFNNSTILITGGTGSFGNKFVEMTLRKYKPKKILIYSRDEMKQWDMSLRYNNEKKIKFIIGDVRDKERLIRALDKVDYVVHAAATKIVPTAEYNPFECVKTNIIGAMNVINACTESKIKKVIALSTDKASNPINLYGASKLASDKLFVAGNSNEKTHSTIFSVVRYGNVMGSRGSVIPYFLDMVKTGKLTITDKRMTRFMISLEEAISLVWEAFQDMKGGEIYVKKIPSMTIMDIAKAVAPKAKYKMIGIRPGEKIHEQMIGFEDVPHTYEYKKYYKILPAIYGWSKETSRIKKGIKVKSTFTYDSHNNKDRMSVKELSSWITKYKKEKNKV